MSRTATSSRDEISEAELEKFVEVAELLAPNRDRHMTVLEQAETPSEKEQAQKKLKRTAQKAAMEAGLSVKRSYAIAHTFRSDSSHLAEPVG